MVDKEIKKFNLIPLFPCKNLWNFNKKEESDNIIKQWYMTFQASDLKGKQFLNLLNDDITDIEPLYTKEGLWIKQFSHFNSLCARAMRAITNYTLIEEYWLRFLLKEEFSCLCRLYPIKSKCYILYKYGRFNKY